MTVLPTQAEPCNPFGLLDLATEIRLNIYNAATEQRKVIVDCTGRREVRLISSSKLPTGLIASCRTIYDEIMPVIAEKTKKLEFTKNLPFFDSSADSTTPLTLVLPHIKEVTLRAKFVQNLRTEDFQSLKVLRVTEMLPAFQNMHTKMFYHVHVDAYALGLAKDVALTRWVERSLANYIKQTTENRKADFKNQLKLSDKNRGFKVFFHASFSTSNLLANMADKAANVKQQLDVVTDFDKEEIVERTFSETSYQKKYLQESAQEIRENERTNPAIGSMRVATQT